MATGGESEKGHEEYFDFLCSVCKRKNKITEAQKFCTDCQEYYCLICVNSHNDFPALRRHQILDKAKFQPGSSVQFPMVPTERCKVHGLKPVDMYCRQHDAVGCPTCMVMNHSACKDKEYIPDYIKTTTKVESLSATAKQLDTLASSLNKLRKTFLKERKNIKSLKETSMQDIRKLRIQINQRLDQLEKHTVQDLEGVFQSLTDKIEATLRELQAAITEVQSAQGKLKSAGSNMSQMFVSIKMANDVASQANEKVTTTQHQVSFTNISFVSDQKIQSLFNELQALGSFHLSESLEQQPRYPGPLPSEAPTQTNTISHVSQTSLSLLHVEDSKKYNVTEKSDKLISAIWSACELYDGTIILSDWSNKKLKRLERNSYMVQDSCRFPTPTFQVCAISSHEVAVCLGYYKLIQFVFVGNDMLKTKQLSTGFQCYDLAYDDERLFVSDDCTSVYVYSITGSRLQQFSVPQSERDGYIHLYSLAVSSDSSTIYVAHSRKGLIILDKKGQLLGEFTDRKLKGPQGVCLYKNNSVLVCGGDSNNVIQFSSDGQIIGEVLKSDQSCLSVCYSKKNSKLIVGLNDGIEVYDINQ